MNKIVDFNGIGYVAATFPVDATTIAYLEANHTNPKTGNVDINGLNLAVKLGADGKVGFGQAEPEADDALLGIIMAYEMDGFASVQIAGGVDLVPTAAAIGSGLKALGVTDEGKLATIASNGKDVKAVAKPSTSGNLFASIIL